MAVAWYRGVPAPHVHDEFSYLLAADTFASGRLTNPPHPHWTFFESFHIINQPTYMSKYPPGQGLLLALGQVSGIGPIGGVWLGMGLMGAAFCWMISGVTSARLALLGTILALLKFGIFDYWSQSYWGGALAATGGALVLGGTIRLLRQPRKSPAVLAAAGALILSLTRPFEGLVLCLAPAAVIAYRLVAAKYCAQRPQWRTALVPAIILLVLGALGHGAYNKAVTGSITKMPYMVHSEQYLITPLFHWNRPPAAAPDFRHPRIEQFATGWELDSYMIQRSVAGLMWTKYNSFAMLFSFFVSLSLVIPAVIGLWIMIRQRQVIVLIATAMVAATLLTTTWVTAHYAAPLASTVALTFALGVRWIALRARGITYLPPVLIGIFIVLVAVQSSVFLASPHPAEPNWTAQRTAILDKLNSIEGNDLVFVRYDDHYSVNLEWVYNSAQIDQQAVVWARNCGDEVNQILIRYYPSRRAWILEAATHKIEPMLSEYKPIIAHN